MLVLFTIVAFICGCIFGLFLTSLLSANKYDELRSDYNKKVEAILNDRSRKDS